MHVCSLGFLCPGRDDGSHYTYMGLSACKTGHVKNGIINLFPPGWNLWLHSLQTAQNPDLLPWVLQGPLCKIKPTGVKVYCSCGDRISYDRMAYIFFWGEKKHISYTYTHQPETLAFILPSLLIQFSPLSAFFSSLATSTDPYTIGHLSRFEDFLQHAGRQESLNSFLQGKKRLYIPLIGIHALEIQRDDLQVRRPSAAVSTCPEQCLVHLCYGLRAGLPGQLPGQLKSLQTGTWNGPQIKSALVCYLLFSHLLSSFFMSQKKMLCCADVKDARTLTRESQQWLVNTRWVHYD